MLKFLDISFYNSLNTRSQYIRIAFQNELAKLKYIKVKRINIHFHFEENKSEMLINISTIGMITSIDVYEDCDNLVTLDSGSFKETAVIRITNALNELFIIENWNLIDLESLSERIRSEYYDFSQVIHVIKNGNRKIPSSKLIARYDESSCKLVFEFYKDDGVKDEIFIANLLINPFVFAELCGKYEMINEYIVRFYGSLEIFIEVNLHTKEVKFVVSSPITTTKIDVKEYFEHNFLEVPSIFLC
jgi:hypothetical protein